MSTQTSNPPAATHRDGAVSAKIWRNHSKNGNPFYSVTFQRVYTDPVTNKAADSSSFRGTDVLKIQQLASRAYNSIAIMQEQDRAAKA